MAHTPGPWRERRGIVIGGGFDIGIVAEENGNVSLIAEVYKVVNQSGRNADVEANARLIAAAPEMLAVCQILVNSTIDDKPGWKDGDPIFAEDVIFDAYEKAKQALAQVGE